MSITLGIYDFFSYIIPGLLYLYVINDFFRIIHWKFIDINSWFQPDQSPNFVVLIVLLVVSFIVGHIFNPLAKGLFDFVFRLIHHKGVADKALLSITMRYPDLKIKFGPKDWSTLFVFIRLRNFELSKFIDKFNADSLMLRNISFALILFTVNCIVGFFVTRDWVFLIIVMLSLVSCVLAFSRSEDFRLRFFKHIYRASLEYGLSVKEVVEYNKSSPQHSRTARKR